MTAQESEIPPPPKGGRVCIVGAGFMGCVIGTLYAWHGYDVVLCDSNREILDSFAARARPIAATFSEDEAEVDALLNRVTAEPALEVAVQGVFLVHEAVQEVLEVKQAVFEQLDRLCPAGVVLATNTSSLLLSDIAARVDNKQRVLGIHYITPGHIIRSVEILSLIHI